MLMIRPSLKSLWKKHIENGLEEDGLFDWTSLSLPPKKAQARVIARGPGVFVGESLSLATVDFAEFGLRINAKKKDGDKIKKGEALFVWDGQIKDILRLERPFLNLLSYASGVATAAHHCVQKIPKKKPQPRVAITRKILPGYRDLAIYSASVGGVFPHRVGLSGGVLIKENHIRAAGGITKAIRLAKAHAPHPLRLEIEVTSLFELEEALKENVDIIMLDNFTPAKIKSALKRIDESGQMVLVEVSGGLREGNLKNFAIPGVDVLSVGYLTHSVVGSDFSLLIR